MPAEVRNNVSYVDLDVHYRFDTFMVYRTRLVFGWVDLMGRKLKNLFMVRILCILSLLVSFGGIAGLFLGCSIISAIEIIIFAIIEAPKFVASEVKLRLKLKRSKTQPNYYQTNIISQVKPEKDKLVFSKNAWNAVSAFQHNNGGGNNNNKY